MAQDTPLILGGHTYISQLGNEPMPSRDLQRQIVEACLDHGIRWFDTTHRPEREGLGRALDALGRRDEATIIAWNFFEDVGVMPDDKLDRAAPYEPRHIDELRAQLRTDVIDKLVVHRVDGGKDVNRRQEELTITWKEKGFVRELGVWEPGPAADEAYPSENPYSFMLCPLNVARPENERQFFSSKKLGWETYAVSPFVRGWELDTMVRKAQKLGADDPREVRAKLADHMLRWTQFNPHVDRTVIAMRRVEWVTANASSVAEGPLTDDERAWLEQVRAAETPGNE